MTSSPIIEDEFEDVLSKAMQGRGLNSAKLSARAGISQEDCEKLLSGNYDESIARLLAGVLHLDADCLDRLANNPPKPELSLPEGIRLHNAPFPIPGYEAMTVNSYSVLPSNHLEQGILIDAGSNFESVLKHNDDTTAPHWKLLLTHTHPDHVVNFEKLAKIVVNAFTPAAEPYAEALPIHEGEVLELGPCRLTAIETPGHSRGGTSYLLEGFPAPVVFVGDALFCYSIGKVKENYDASLTIIQEKILSLPPETILCPGHGPITTVAFERKHNPFFA